MELETNEVKFDLLALPDPPLEIILEYLDFESKKNLRLMGRDYADFVMKLNPGLRKWKIEFLQIEPNKLDQYIGRAKEKGYTDLKGFNLVLSFPCMHHEYERNCICYPFNQYIQFLQAWKADVVAMDAHMTEKTEVLSVMKFPKLDCVKLSRDDKGGRSQEYVVQFLRNHADTLRSLKMGMCFMDELPGDVSPAFSLESLTFEGGNNYWCDGLVKTYLKFAPNIKVLDYGDLRVDMSDVYFPNLKRFHPGRWIYESYTQFLARHANTIETMITPFPYDMDELEMWFPHMPKLRALGARNDEFMMRYLDAGTLEYLLAPLKCYEVITTDKFIKLKGLWYVIDHWFDEYHILTRKLDLQFPQVARIIVITDDGQRISNRWVKKIKELFPEAKVQGCKSWDKIVERFLETYGLE